LHLDVSLSHVGDLEHTAQLVYVLWSTARPRL
jgi:hypothetical protein